MSKTLRKEEEEMDENGENLCQICQEDGRQLFQCCSNLSDRVCEECWTQMINSTMEKGQIRTLFNNELNCCFCQQAINAKQLPPKIQDRLENLLSTIPKTTQPTSVEDFSYRFDKNGELRHCVTDEKFQFLTQRHYNALGQCIESFIQRKMKESPWNYREIWLPLRDDGNHHDQVNIFVSEDFETNENGCLILIQGSGVVRPGQWARSCCINESLDIGGKTRR